MAHSIYLALMLTVLIAFFPKDSHSVFQEPPYSVTEYTGIIAEFRCRNPWKDHVGWRINGVSLGSITNTTIVTHCNPSTRIQDGVYVLIIKAAVECNGTQVQCVAYNYDNYELTEYSSNATLTVLSKSMIL